jgi:hypothetical protein
MTSTLHPDQFSVQALRAAAFEGGNPELSPALALQLLALKEYPQREDDLRQVLISETTLPRLRVTAALALGRLGTDGARAVLLEMLSVRDSHVLRGVVSALADIGGQAVIEGLRQLAPERLDARTRMVVTQAAYGSNVSGFDLPSPDALVLLEMSGRGSRQIASAPVPEEVAKTIWSYWHEEGMLIAADRENALRLDCLGRELVVFLNRRLRTSRPGELTQQRWVAGVVMAHELHRDEAGEEADEDEGWSHEYTVLTQPGGDDSLDILVTSSIGVAYAGKGMLREGRVEFSLRAVDLPGARATIIEGAYERGRIRLTRVEVATQAQPRLRPQRLR